MDQKKKNNKMKTGHSTGREKDMVRIIMDLYWKAGIPELKR